MSRFRFLPLALLIGSGVLSCDSPTAPDAFNPDPVVLERASAVHIDLTANRATSGTLSADGATRSLVGRDVIDVVVTSLTRTSYNKKKDLVRFDVAIVNRIPGVELRSPTLAPVAPNATPSVFVFPYLAKVTRGDGSINESDDWNGAPFSFFNDIACRNGRNSDCYPWESYPAPVQPGAVTPARTVGFIVEKSVTAFDVYFLTAADIVKIPAGSLAVNVGSALRGALAGVTVRIDDDVVGATDVDGLARFASLRAGQHTLRLEALPEYCTAPALLTTTVNADAESSVTLDVVCVEPPRLEADATSHNFGVVDNGAPSASATILIINAGGAPAGAPAATLSGANASDFTILATTCSAALNGGAHCSVEVAAAPTAVGARSASLTVSASPGGSASVQLAAVSVRHAKLEVGAASADFGVVMTGQSAMRTVTVTNSGERPAASVTTELSGATPAAFVVDPTSTCGAALGGGATCTVVVRYAPTDPATAGATLTITGAPGGAVTVALSATAIAPVPLTVPQTLDFGTQPYGYAVTVPMTIRNPADVASGPITATVLEGGTFDNVMFASECGESVAAGATCVVRVTWVPGKATGGQMDKTIRIAATPGGTFDVHVSGTARTGLQFDPTQCPQEGCGTVDFGTVEFATTSVHPAIRILRVGPGARDPLQLTFDRAQTDFRAESSCIGDDICAIVVTFAPTTPGTKSATLTVTGAPGGTLAIPVTGESAGFTLSGDVQLHVATIGGPAPAFSFTLTNAGGLDFDDLAFGFENAVGGTYSVTSHDCLPLRAHTACTVHAAFAPATSGASGATLRVTAPHGGTAISRVSGAVIDGATAPLSVDQVSYSYGVVITGTPASHAFSIANPLTAPVGPLTFSLDGADASLFTVDRAGCPVDLAPGQSCAVHVVFSPTEYKLGVSARLIVTGASGSPVYVTLAGTANVQTLSASGPVVFGLTNSGATRNVIITNAPQAMQSHVQIQIKGPDAPSFSTDIGSCFLFATESCTIVVRFSPNFTGLKAATLEVTGLPGGLLTIPLSGELQVLSSVDQSIDFGAVGPDGSIRTVTISNPSSFAVGGVSISIDGPDASQFRLLNPNCFLLAGGTCAVPVAFVPATLGTKTATIRFSASGPTPLTIGLTGTGLPAPRLQVSEGFFNFGDALFGLPTSHTFTVTNVGGSATAMLQTIFAPDPRLSVTNTCAILAAGASCTVIATVTSNGAGTLDRSFTVADPNSPAVFVGFSMHATTLAAPQLQIVEGSEIDVGQVTPAGVIVTITVRNTGGRSGPLSVSEGSGTGAGSVDLTILSNNCQNVRLDPGSDCDINVLVAAVSAGDVRKTLTISAAPGGSVTATIKGTVVSHPR